MKKIIFSIITLVLLFLLIIVIKNKVTGDNTFFYGNSNGNIANGGYVISNDDTFFINDNFLPSQGKLYKYSDEDNYLELIVNDCSIDLDTKQLQVLNNIASANLNISNDKIYYTASSEIIEKYEMLDIGGNIGIIYQMDIDGGKNELIYNKAIFNLIYNNDYLYFISVDDFTIKKMNIKTKKIEKLSTNIYQNFNINDSYLICSNSSTIDILDLYGKIPT